jgi:hypothetical protein
LQRRPHGSARWKTQYVTAIEVLLCSIRGQPVEVSRPVFPKRDEVAVGPHVAGGPLSELRQERPRVRPHAPKRAWVQVI